MTNYSTGFFNQYSCYRTINYKHNVSTEEIMQINATCQKLKVAYTVLTADCTRSNTYVKSILCIALAVVKLYFSDMEASGR